MRNADGRIGGVHMLSTFAAGTVGINSEIFRLDNDFDGFVNLRRNINAGERSVPSLGLIKRRNADESVHSDLAGQKTVRIFAVHAKCGGLDPRLFARLIVIEHSLKSLALGPAQIHAHEHLGPILRLSAASARMNGHDGITRIVIAGEQGLGLELINLGA